MEERQGDVEARPVVVHAHAGLGQDCLAYVEAEVLGVVWSRRGSVKSSVPALTWPGTRVQVEHQVITAPPPGTQPVQPGRHVPDKVLGQGVPGYQRSG